MFSNDPALTKREKNMVGVDVVFNTLYSNALYLD